MIQIVPPPPKVYKKQMNTSLLVVLWYCKLYFLIFEKMSNYNHIFFSCLQNSECLRVLIIWRQICYKHFGLSKVCFLKMPCYPNLNLNEILSLTEGPLFQNSWSKINKTFLEKTFTNCHPICTLLYEFCFVTIFGVQTKI